RIDETPSQPIQKKTDRNAKLQVLLQSLRTDRRVMAVIEDPILNSPFHEPTRYFKFDDEGITLNGEEKQYYPDFIAQVGDLNVIIEVTGEARKDKIAKVTTARTLWVPAVNNHGGFGTWAFVEVTDPGMRSGRS